MRLLVSLKRHSYELFIKRFTIRGNITKRIFLSQDCAEYNGWHYRRKSSNDVIHDVRGLPVLKILAVEAIRSVCKETHRHQVQSLQSNPFHVRVTVVKFYLLWRKCLSITRLSEDGMVVGQPPDLPVERLVICQGKCWIFASFNLQQLGRTETVGKKKKEDVYATWGGK